MTMREPTISVPLSKYRELMDFKRRAVEMRTPSRFPKSPIEQDPEIAVYLCEQFGKRRVVTILEDCAKVYGWKRTPSISAAYRYWRRIRDEHSKGV